MDKNSHVNDRRVGDGNFRTSQNPTLNRSPKNLLQVITLAAPMSVPHLVQTRPWGLLGNEWNITIFYLYFFFGNSPTRQTRRRIFTLGGSNDADSRKGVLFGVWFILLAILEMKSSKTPNFFGGGAKTGGFKPNSQNIESFIPLTLRHRFQPNFAKNRDHQVVIVGCPNRPPTRPTNTSRRGPPFCNNRYSISANLRPL